MKNFVKYSLLALALFAPTTGFAMEPSVSITAPGTAWNGTDCTICRSEETVSEPITLECHPSHIYHRDCVTQWLQNHNTCPTCRAEVSLDQRTDLGLEALIPAVGQPNFDAFAFLMQNQTPEEKLADALWHNNVDLLNEAIGAPDFHINQFLTLNITRIEGIGPGGRVREFFYHHDDEALRELRVEISDSKTDFQHLDQTGSSFLMIAARISTPEIIDMLIDADADINIDSDTGKTAITHAIEADRLDNVDALLAHGATTTTWEKLQIMKLRIPHNKGKIAAGACALAAAGIAYYIQAK